MKKYVMGLDFGTLSVRAVIIDALTGKEAASAVCEYEHGVMDRALPNGAPISRGMALEVPADYIKSMREVIARSLADASLMPDEIAGIGVDFTASTVVCIDKNGRPMCEYEEFSGDENAYAKLWKSVSATYEAQRMTEVARERGERWLDIYGGYVSPEYLFPKVYQTLRGSPRLYECTDKFMEAGDWIVLLLTGKHTAGICTAGFKAMWNAENGFPSNEYFCAVDTRLSGIVGTKVCDGICASGAAAGYVSANGAQLFGLCEGTAVCASVMDAHAGMPALGICGTAELMLILGTSAGYVINSEHKTAARGICGYTLGGIYEGLYTYDQSQRCFGDVLERFVEKFLPESYKEAARERGLNIHAYLRERAQALRIGESGLMVLDWFLGSKSTFADDALSGLILGLRLTTTPEEIYRALLEGAAYGARMIIENYTTHGIAVEKIIASGGIALKDSLLMQIMSDVIGLPISVSESAQACACGSAIFASVAAKIHPDIKTAAHVMASPVARVYTPVKENVGKYDELYAEYKTLCGYFALGENGVMKRLIKMSEGKYSKSLE